LLFNEILSKLFNQFLSQKQINEKLVKSFESNEKQVKQRVKK
jgi:hypothetical protein